ncbi:MAG: helix-turn-helix domain-containing protein [Limnospira sp.]
MPYPLPTVGCTICGSCHLNDVGNAPADRELELAVARDLLISNCVNSPCQLQTEDGEFRYHPSLDFELFPNGRSNPFASSLVIWEATNILTQGSSLPWHSDRDQKLCYRRSIKKGEGEMCFRIADRLDYRSLPQEAARQAIADLDIKAAALNLIYAALATNVDRPWEQPFAIDSQQIETYLGLDRRKDLDKQAKLALIESLVLQPCQLTVSLDWPRQGAIGGFTLEEHPVWELIDINHHTDPTDGHLVGLTLMIRAGRWAEYFLNRKAAREKTAFYQTGILPEFILKSIMRYWQQHEGAVRAIAWLLFKLTVGKTQPVAVSTLLRIGYGEEKVRQSLSDRDRRKKLVRTFEADLKVLYDYGINPIFDPVTYPPQLQPMWVKLLTLPEDGEEALEFWMNDAQQDVSITDPSPRYKLYQLMNARILQFELPPEWGRAIADLESIKSRKIPRRTRTKRVKKSISTLGGTWVLENRKRKGWSQRQLAQSLGKSQSWVRDIERGRIRIKPALQEKIKQLLERQ